jgi:NADH:ubiquinone oxidoreductase subunit 6 (subunit J)
VLEALVVIALIGTVAALLAGVVAMARGGDFNRKWGNRLMRARVAMQALAVGLMLVLYLLYKGGE